MYEDRINIILEAINVITNNLDCNASIINLQIEESLGYTLGYISELFKKEIGVTTHEYIMYRKSNNIDRINQIEYVLENKLMTLDLLDNRLIKKMIVEGDDVIIEIDEKEFFIELLEIPIMLLPKNKFTDTLIYNNNIGEKDAVNNIYTSTMSFIQQQMTIDVSDYNYMIMGIYREMNPTLYFGLYIFSPFNKYKIKYTNSKKRILNKQEIFQSIATVYNLKVFNNSMPESLVKMESKIRLTLICYITKQYVENYFKCLNDLVLYISAKYTYIQRDIYETLFELINKGIIVFVTKTQKKYYCENDINNDELRS